MVSDDYNSRIQELFLDDRPARVFVRFTEGTKPAGITQCGGDYIVADGGKHRVMRIDRNGTIKWSVGSKFNTRDEFNDPRGVAMLLDGRVVVADYCNNRLQVLNAGTGAVEGTITRSDGVDWNYPVGVAVDTQGLLYVTEYHRQRVVVVEVDGTVVHTLGSSGDGPGQLNFPFGVTVDGNGNVLVGNIYNRRVVVFHSDGTMSHLAAPKSKYDCTYNALITSDNRLVVSGYGFVAEY